MYARVRARQKKHEICLHSALYDYNTLVISHLSVYTLSARRLHYLHSAKIVWTRFEHPHRTEITLKRMRGKANGRQKFQTEQTLRRSPNTENSVWHTPKSGWPHKHAARDTATKCRHTCQTCRQCRRSAHKVQTCLHYSND